VVKGSEYAKYYFIVRTLADSIIKESITKGNKPEEDFDSAKKKKR
jgi:hypothetical protein